jgi:hypothetical protein
MTTAVEQGRRIDKKEVADKFLNSLKILPE